MNYRYVRLMAVLMLLCSVLPFGVTSEAAPPGADPIKLREVTFAHGLTDDMQAMDPDPAGAFTPDETIYLALVIEGRPKSGLVAAHFYWGDDFMTEVAVDLADVNSGLLFSFGQDTYVGYNLSYDDSFIISDRYRAEVFYEGDPLGVYPFRVIPPLDAIPSKINEVVLARGADEDYNPIDLTDVFDTDEKVFLVGNADLGIDTWIQADWYVNGERDAAGTRSITVSENADDVPFSFAYLPDGGWLTGTHTVTLTINDVEVGRYPFAIEQPIFDGATLSHPVPHSALEQGRLATVLIVGDWGGGSGSIVDPRGYILTNYHVIRNEREGDLRVGINGPQQDKPPEKFYTVEVVDYDPQLDLALLRITGDENGYPTGSSLNLVTVRIGDSDRLGLGDEIAILGFPDVGGETLTLTKGTVSGFLEDEMGNKRGWIKSDAELAPGNSGGLAINEAGELIGVPSRNVPEARTLGRMGYLRAINLAHPLLRQVR